MAHTVSELLEELRFLVAEGHGDKEVQLAYNYGDHWRTTVAQPIESVELRDVKFSEYHRMNEVLPMCDEFDEETGDLVPAEGAEREVIILG
jgi:hypothetical protein